MRALNAKHDTQERSSDLHLLQRPTVQTCCCCYWSVPGTAAVVVAVCVVVVAVAVCGSCCCCCGWCCDWRLGVARCEWATWGARCGCHGCHRCQCYGDHPRWRWSAPWRHPRRHLHQHLRQWPLAAHTLPASLRAPPENPARAGCLRAGPLRLPCCWSVAAAEWCAAQCWLPQPLPPPELSHVLPARRQWVATVQSWLPAVHLRLPLLPPRPLLPWLPLLPRLPLLPPLPLLPQRPWLPPRLGVAVVSEGEGESSEKAVVGRGRMGQRARESVGVTFSFCAAASSASLAWVGEHSP